MKEIRMSAILEKCILSFSLLLMSLLTLANPTLASKEQIGMYKNSKTCVVLEDGLSFYNAFIKDAVQKYWKSTEYELITQQEFEKRRFSSKYSFLMLMQGVYDKDPGGVSYNYISLVLGDTTTNLTKMPELCSIPLSYSDNSLPDYEYVIPSVVKFMQKHAKNLETERFIISLKGLKYYNGLTSLKGKVLLLNKDFLSSNANSPDKIRAVYPYKIKLLTSQEIKDEIALNPSNTLFHFHVGPSENSGAGKCFEMIFDLDGNLCYYNSRKITNDNEDGFNMNDFANLK